MQVMPANLAYLIVCSNFGATKKTASDILEQAVRQHGPQPGLTPRRVYEFHNLIIADIDLSNLYSVVSEMTDSGPLLAAF
jgi:hypothetical protein